jgi:hypothetical protein
MQDQKELTFGQKAVGVTFNPSQNQAVASVKQKFADLIDDLDGLRNDPNMGAGVKRHASVAITDLETAQMRAVKALTWVD